MISDLKRTDNDRLLGSMRIRIIPRPTPVTIDYDSQLISTSPQKKQIQMVSQKTMKIKVGPAESLIRVTDSVEPNYEEENCDCLDSEIDAYIGFSDKVHGILFHKDIGIPETPKLEDLKAHRLTRKEAFAQLLKLPIIVKPTMRRSRSEEKVTDQEIKKFNNIREKESIEEKFAQMKFVRVEPIWKTTSDPAFTKEVSVSSINFGFDCTKKEINLYINLFAEEGEDLLQHDKLERIVYPVGENKTFQDLRLKLITDINFEINSANNFEPDQNRPQKERTLELQHLPSVPIKASDFGFFHSKNKSRQRLAIENLFEVQDSELIDLVSPSAVIVFGKLFSPVDRGRNNFVIELRKTSKTCHLILNSESLKFKDFHMSRPSNLFVKDIFTELKRSLPNIKFDELVPYQIINRNIDSTDTKQELGPYHEELNPKTPLKYLRSDTILIERKKYADMPVIVESKKSILRANTQRAVNETDESSEEDSASLSNDHLITVEQVSGDNDIFARVCFDRFGVPRIDAVLKLWKGVMTISQIQGLRRTEIGQIRLNSAEIESIQDFILVTAGQKVVKISVYRPDEVYRRLVVCKDYR